MIRGMLGKKLGMTQVYDQKGVARGVTVLAVGPCTVLQVKKVEGDGYEAVQLGFEDKRRSLAKKPESGHVKKAGAEPKRFIREVPVDAGEAVDMGSEVGLDVLEGVARVDVTGVMKGRGFTGGMKRWGFHGLSASHGTKRRHRAPGSIGASASPSRVIKGMRMAGHMGACRRTVLNLMVVEVDKEKNLLVVNGAVPGANGGYVIIRPSRR